MLSNKVIKDPIKSSVQDNLIMGSDARARKIEELAAIDIFRGLTPTQLSAVAACVKTMTFPANAVLFSRYEDSGKVYCVRTGLLKAYIPEMSLALIGPRESAGEFNFNTNAGHTASVGTLLESELFVVDSVDLRSLVDKITELAGNLALLRVKRMETSTRCTVTGTKSIAARLAAFLLTLADKVGEPQQNGSISVPVTFGQEEIGQFVPTDQPTVSRTFTKFANQKLIKMNGSHIIILDALKLKNVV